MRLVRIGVVGEYANDVTALVEQKLKAFVPDVAKSEKQNARLIFQRIRQCL